MNSSYILSVLFWQILVYCLTHLCHIMDYMKLVQWSLMGCPLGVALSTVGRRPDEICCGRLCATKELILHNWLNNSWPDFRWILTAIARRGFGVLAGWQRNDQIWFLSTMHLLSRRLWSALWGDGLWVGTHGQQNSSAPPKQATRWP